MDQLMRELEDAAEIAMAPPNIVSSEQRRCAELVFLNFQKTRSPFSLCQFLLANSKSSYVQFQAASLIKQSIIREWGIQEFEFIDQLRVGLMNFVLHNTGLENYVREQLLLAMTIIVKRNSVQTDSDIVSAFLTEISTLISSGDSAMQLIGCSILTCLLNEFSSSTRASDIGLSWEYHLKAKKKFEKTDLKRLFQFCLQGLSELNKINPPIPTEAEKLLKRFLYIAEQVLTWNFQFSKFLPRKLVGMFESQQNPNLRPTAEWRCVFLDPNVVGLFFKLHWQVRDNQDLCHTSLQCLHQLSSVNGVILNKEEDKCAYVKNFFENLLQLISSGPLKEYESVGISNIIHRLHIFFHGVFYVSMHSKFFEAYLKKLAELTCYFLERAVQEEATSNESLYMEAFDTIIDAWTTILSRSLSIEFSDMIGVIEQFCTDVFNHYLKTHLSPPDGMRPTDNSLEDICEMEEDDRIKYCDQLCNIGMFGRKVIDHSIPLLVRLLEDRLSRLHELLQQIHQSSDNAHNSSLTTALNCLNEDLHWLVMISGHLLTCTSEEVFTTILPIEIINFCQAHEKNINMNITLQVLASPSHRISDIPGAEESADKLVRLVAAVFRLCEFEKTAAEANLIHLLSPELAISLVWFLGRFSTAYLMPIHHYSGDSEVITQAFGKETEGALWTLGFVLGKLESNLTIWRSESKLMVETALTLTQVLNNTERGDKAIQCQSLVNIVKQQSSGAYQMLPIAAKRSILKSLVIVGTANKVHEIKEKYWNELLKPLQDRYQNLLSFPNFAQTYQTKQVQTEVIDLLECLIGIIDGCASNNVNQIMPFLNSLFESLVDLADLYHNCFEVVILIFQVFNLATKRVLCFISQIDAKVMYECCISIVQSYVNHNTGRFSKELNLEDDQYQDLLLLMQLLTELNVKDFFDNQISTDSDADESDLPELTAGKVSLYGLSLIMPLINSEVLKFPNLSLQFYKLVVAVSDFQPGKICEISGELRELLLSAILFGLTSYIPVNSMLCLDFISVISLYIVRNHLREGRMYAALEPFLKVVFEMLLFQPMETDLTQGAGMALYSLVCCYNSQYEALVQELIHSQSDPVIAQRLLTSFTDFSKRVTFSVDRMSRLKFKDEFDKFITEVRGYLCVK